MTMPRCSHVSLSDTPWYHVVCRCVRRAFLCGEDQVTGQSFEHRRGWIEERIGQLCSLFAIDVAAYAVMSNHYHLVVRVDDERVASWSDDEVLRRWTRIFSGPLFVRRYQDDEEREKLSDSELNQVFALAAIYRKRLCDLSWFMRVLNETIARKANAEDNCTGRFWEGRFKSQALLDDQAVLMAMSYVDLNPVRAGMCDVPEQGDHTSIQQRLKGERAAIATCKPAGDRQEATTAVNQDALRIRCEQGLSEIPCAPLLPFEPTETFTPSIPFAYDDYLELIDTLGRIVHPGKRGAIAGSTPAILVRLGMNAEMFIDGANQMLQTFAQAIGAPQKLIDLATHKNSRYLHGLAKSRKLYGDEMVA